jgi:hypothetical protein
MSEKKECLKEIELYTNSMDKKRTIRKLNWNCRVISKFSAINFVWTLSFLRNCCPSIGKLLGEEEVQKMVAALMLG